MDVDQKVALIQKNTQEIVTQEELTELFVTKKHPHAYMGFAPTGRMHIGHLVPLVKIADFLNAGCKFTFLIADLHAFLDDNKSPWELLDARFEAYKQTAMGVLEAIGAPVKNVSFVRGSDFEFERAYQEELLQMIGETTLSRAQRAASEVVRFGDHPLLGGFVYPFYQIQDVYALDADIALGGIDQRGIYMLGRDLADKMNKDKYVCAFTPLLPGLTGDKMSSSVAGSKIDLFDTPEVIKEKLNKAYCPAKQEEDNGILAFIKYVVFATQKNFVISRPEKFGGEVTFNTYEDLASAYTTGDIHPLDLKNALASTLAKLLKPVRERVSNDILAQAYPQ